MKARVCRMSVSVGACDRNSVGYDQYNSLARECRKLRRLWYRSAFAARTPNEPTTGTNFASKTRSLG
jgi:hypothetical protein